MLKLKTISLTLQHCMPSIKRNSLYQDPGSSKNSLRTCQAETFSSVSWSAQYQNEKDPYRLKVNRNSLHHYRSSSEISSSTCQAETVRSLPWSGWAVPTGNMNTYALMIHRRSSFQYRSSSHISSSTCQTETVSLFPWSFWDWQAGKCTYGLLIKQFFAIQVWLIHFQ